MSYFNGCYGACWWSYFEGEIDQKDWDRFVEFSRRSYTKGKPGDVILTIPFSTTPPSALQRRQVAELVEETRATNPIRHHAFATDSKVLLAINTAINWLSRKPYEERTFADPKEAAAWLASCNPGVDAVGLIKHIQANVPAAQRWPAIAA